MPSVSLSHEPGAAFPAIIAERNARVDENKTIEFHIGIDVGDVVIDGDDIYGCYSVIENVPSRQTYSFSFARVPPGIR